MKTKTGRASYALHILHISTDHNPSDTSPDELGISVLRDTFPEHTFSSIPLYSALESWPAPSHLTSQIEDYTTLTPQFQLNALLRLTVSPTARADLLSQLRAEALSAFASTHSIPVLLLAHTATALAELTLSETAKGRGGAVAGLVAESGSSDAKGVRTFFPMRDLLRRDVEAYVSSQTGLEKLVRRTVEKEGRWRALKEVSIDELARSYFVETEGKFSGVVHNVVRTAGKLETDERAGEGGRCACCGDVMDGTEGWRGPGMVVRDEVEGMCGRCRRDFGVGAG